ncbi:MAG TPA: folate-binding protein [Caulobacter sp.]|nr:folate-binding protein [Caulobacter sp.]
MNDAPTHALLRDRALVSVTGPDWRSFLQGLLSQDVEGLAVGELRFGALLSPQGRLLFDLFILGRQDGCWLDVASDRREALIARLAMYRLRAKVEIAALDGVVSALFSDHSREGGNPSDRSTAAEQAWVPASAGTNGYCQDPRLPALGLRGYGVVAPPGERADAAAYDRHRLALGVPDTADFGEDSTYPIEADFDLLNGIDFKKGCFVGQETTSRMKRRGQIRSRMLPITFDGPPPAFGAEILNGELRAGQVLSGVPGRAMALLRLDRLEGPTLTADGRTVSVGRPAWLESPES